MSFISFEFRNVGNIELNHQMEIKTEKQLHFQLFVIKYQSMF